MRLVSPSFEILNPPKREEVLRHLELCGRVCYKSEDKMTEESASRMVRMLIERGHESPIEHFSISVRIICDRGVSHEWVRHRVASYSQESTRYCNYSNAKFGSELTFIKPYFAEPGSPLFTEWEKAMENAENSYFAMLKEGAKPEDARSVLPNSLKTEFICTMNLREWRHFFALRCAPAAHPAMREIAIPLRDAFRELLPELF
ncbi:MAG: FAD-dependent thymidylate synthase [Clostridia bacterium]|nr:FAD-dependent thymidylate synthase [Clostridia bacterium]